MSEFEIKDKKLIIFDGPGREPKTFPIEGEDGERLIRFIAEELETTKENVINLLQESGPKEL